MSDETPNDSSARMAAMTLADMRAYVTSEMSRFKLDISALYEKVNQLKGTHTSDKMALITQLNAEFTKFTNPMNDITMMLQKILGDSEHSAETIDSRLDRQKLELEKQFAEFRLEVSERSPQAKIQSLQSSIEALSKTVTDMQTSLDDRIKDLSTKVGGVSSKVKSLSWKLALLLSALGWILNQVAGDSIKSIFTAKLSVPASQPAPVKEVKPIKDTVNKAGN